MRTIALLSAVLVLAVGCVMSSEPEVPAPSPTLMPPVSTVTTIPGGSSAPRATSAAPESPFVPLMIDPETAGRMTSSWREGCPVPLEDLRLLRLHYHDLAGETQVGEMVVAADVADDVVSVFEKLYDVGFPIERMELVDAYGGDDLVSMQANNTSAFNCRKIEGSVRWSEHAYGSAIDVNPLLNPWVRGSTVSPVEGAAYTDRSLQVPGMIHPDDVVVRAFESIGWTWGGAWITSKDYQHFSQTGR